MSRTKKTMIPSERSPEDNIPKSIHERQIPSTVVYVYDLSINLVRNNVPPHVLRHSCWNNGARGGKKQTNKQTNKQTTTNKQTKVQFKQFVTVRQPFQTENCVRAFTDTLLDRAPASSLRCWNHAQSPRQNPALPETLGSDGVCLHSWTRSQSPC